MTGAGRLGTSVRSASSAAPAASALVDRWQEWVPFTVIGVAYVIAGGLVAAVTAPAPTEHTSWAAAYLVLVGGVAQAGLGLGQAMFTDRIPAPVVAVQAAGWNLANVAVLAGTLLGVTALVDLGGALLLVTLTLLGRGLRPSRMRPANGARRWFLYGYRLLVLILLISVPVGLVLARLRS